VHTHKADEQKLASEIKVVKIHGEDSKYFSLIFLKSCRASPLSKLGVLLYL
jgi:hypothetical protein